MIQEDAGGGLGNRAAATGKCAIGNHAAVNDKVNRKCIAAAGVVCIGVVRGGGTVPAVAWIMVVIQDIFLVEVHSVSILARCALEAVLLVTLVVMVSQKDFY